MASKKILIISDDIGTNVNIETLLSMDGYEVIFAYDELVGVEKARLEKPDLILLDTNLPGVDGLSISRKLKQDPVTRFIPIIALVDLIDTLTGKTTKLDAEAHLLKPFNAEELKDEIEKLLKRTIEQLSANPLTNLPGNIIIEQEVNSRIKTGKNFAVCYLDFDNFKPFNDYYGFYKGDQVIKLLSAILLESSRLKGNRDDLVGHIGGDDFVLVTTPDKVDAMCAFIAEKFDTEVKKHYEKQDLEKGFITTKDRHFKLNDFPIMTISMCVATNEKREIAHYGKVVDILVEMKKYVKSIKDKKNSMYVKDRRKSDT